MSLHCFLCASPSVTPATHGHLSKNFWASKPLARILVSASIAMTFYASKLTSKQSGAFANTLTNGY